MWKRAYPGFKIANEYLVLGVYSAIGLGAYAALRGPSKEAKPQPGAAPPAVLGGKDAYVEPFCSRSEEESFIKQFLAEAQKEGVQKENK